MSNADDRSQTWWRTRKGIGAIGLFVLVMFTSHLEYDHHHYHWTDKRSVEVYGHNLGAELCPNAIEMFAEHLEVDPVADGGIVVVGRWTCEYERKAP